MRFFIRVIMLFSSMWAHAQTNKPLIKGEMMVDDNKRSFSTYLPTNNDHPKMPLAISLHGGFASPKGMFHLADFRPLADREGLSWFVRHQKSFGATGQILTV